MARTARLLVYCAVGLGAALASPVASSADATETRGRSGHPKVVLDHLTLPAEASTPKLRKHLERVLQREARRADWGVGAGHRIEYRFVLEKLEIALDGDVLRVRCEAIGRLPRGKSARSKLSFGGDPKDRRKVIERVVEIVARGVVTRLAELERKRRGGR